MAENASDPATSAPPSRGGYARSRDTRARILDAALAEASEAVAAGDLTTRVPVERGDEIGTLERAFNAMTASLESRSAELERSNRDLQDFAAVASHDLQGPLVTISKLAQLLDAEAAEGRQAELARHLVGLPGP